MLIAYIINIILLCVVFATSYQNVVSGKKQKEGNCLSLTVLILFLISWIVGIRGNTYIASLNYQAFLIAGAVIWCVSIFLCGNKIKILRLIFASLIVAFSLEILIFNFNAFQLTFDKYENQPLDISDADATTFDKVKSVSTGNNIVIEFKNINKKIGTLKIDATSTKNKRINIDIAYADATNREYREKIGSAQIVGGCKRSYTVPINASGEVSKLKLSFKADDKEIIKINSLEINSPIAFRFSIVRILLILILVLLKYLLCDCEILKKSFVEKEKLCKTCGKIITITFIVFAFFLILFQRSESLISIPKDFVSTSGNQITQEIVDAFSNGQVSLMKDVSPELAELDNHYDRSQRKGIDLEWDHLLYNGKYYSYYGIASVLLLFLPYHILTGCYFPSSWAVFIFGCLGIIFLYKLYMAYMREFFSDMKISLILMGLVMLELITGIWFCFSSPKFYEIAQTTGFMFCTAGFYCVIKSRVIGSGDIKHIYIALSSVMLSLAVLSRPTLTVYCICALILIYSGYMKESERKQTKKFLSHKKYFISALLPFVIFGSIQAAYNFVRFGSPLDFGIEYSLTVNDFINAQYHPHLDGIGFYNYLIAFPSFKPTFPFVYGNVELFNPNGYYFTANNKTIGLIWMAMPLMSYIYAKKAYLLSKSKNRTIYSIMFVAICIVAPFAIIASIWESGYCTRYKVDFAWQLFIGAITIAFIIYKNCKNEGVKNILTKTFFVSLIACFIFNFALIYDFVTNVTYFNAEVYDKYFCLFERVFEFWR